MKVEAKLTRRGFLKASVAFGAASALVGCSSGDADDRFQRTQPEPDPLYSKDTKYVWGTSAHNCGGRCVIRAQVENGVIKRFLTDETLTTYNGDSTEPESRNSMQQRACSRCRGYKGRLYHTGRLTTPLKQTKERGDLSGFKAITWQEAYDEIAERLVAVKGKYGDEAFHSIYACGAYGSQYQGGSYHGIFRNLDGTEGPVIKLLDGGSHYTTDYSFHQASYMGSYGGEDFVGLVNSCTTPNANNFAEDNKYVIMWGTNTPTTHNAKAYGWIKGVEDMKKRDPQSKVIFIGPELSESAIAFADTWVRAKPFTDVALILGMLYHMLDNTIDLATGAVKSNPMLDMNYIDTMVHGFFESPAYVIETDYNVGTDKNRGSTVNPDAGAVTVNPTPTTPATPSTPAYYLGWTEVTNPGPMWFHTKEGTIRTTAPDSTESSEYTRVTSYWQKGTTYSYNKRPYNYVKAVPNTDTSKHGYAGLGCFAAYILGTDATAIASGTGLPYATGSNYMATAFAGTKRISAVYPTPVGSTQLYKSMVTVPKTPAWASAITGVPEQTIKDLAELYVNAGKNKEPMWNEWSGGQMKQADGCITYFAIEALMAITQNWGVAGTGFGNNKAMSSSTALASNTDFANNAFYPETTYKKSKIWHGSTFNTYHPKPSVSMWHNAIRAAFANDLSANGYTPNMFDFSTFATAAPSWNPIGTTVPNVTGVVYADDGGTKALVKRTYGTDGSLGTFIDSDDGGEYFVYDGGLTAGATASNSIPAVDGTTTYSGFRFILNSGGNIPVNQHANTIDSAELFKNLPTYQYDTDGTGTIPNRNKSAMEDAFYMVTLDNFMSPSARYSDYVLPGKTTWEQENFCALELTGNVYIPAVSDAPGEAVSSFEFGRDLVKAYHSKKTGGISNAAELFTGGSATDTMEDMFRKQFDTLKSKASAFADKSWEEFKANPVVYRSPNNTTKAANHTKRTAFDKAFATPETKFYVGISSATGFGGSYFGQGQYANPSTAPHESGRFHVYSDVFVWKFEHLYDKWHGHLPVAQRGQNNQDADGDLTVYPIPLYYAYEDYFAQAYGVTTAQLGKRYLLTTTHDRFRAHSSQAENPYLRELTHRIQGGELYSGNDSGRYATHAPSNATRYNNLNMDIDDDGIPNIRKYASYVDIWVNDEDFSTWNDGDLVLVENEIGAVVCALRKTRRCVKGHVNLHQGCWFDPRLSSDQGRVIDVGGNCNTLMASTPSRADHGNAQQSAYVTIKRIG